MFRYFNQLLMRPSTITEAIYHSSPALWLSAARGVTSAAGVVTSWQSRVGGYAFSQTTADYKPTLVADGINGHPAIDFDGTNDRLKHTGAILSGTTGHILVVAKSDTASAQYMFAQSDESTGDKYTFLGRTATVLRFGQNDAGTADLLDGSTAIGTTSARLYHALSDGSTVAMRVDGAMQTITETSGSNEGDWFGDTSDVDNAAIGAVIGSSTSGYWNGQIAEVLVYDGVVLPDHVYLSLEIYLARKYAIALP